MVGHRYCFSVYANVNSSAMLDMKFGIISVFGRLAQLVRALRSHRRGHPFESDIAHGIIYSPGVQA